MKINLLGLFLGLFLYKFNFLMVDGFFLDKKVEVYRFEVITFGPDKLGNNQNKNNNEALGCYKKIKNSYYNDYNYRDGDCDVNYDGDNGYVKGIHKCCLKGLSDYGKGKGNDKDKGNGISEKLLTCYSDMEGEDGGGAGGFYMYNCVKTEIVDIKGSETNKKIFIGLIAFLIFFMAVLLVYIFFGGCKSCCGLKSYCYRCCCFYKYRKIERLRKKYSLCSMSSLSSLISYGDGNGDGDGDGDSDRVGDDRDLVDLELEYVGNKFNGGVLSFYEDEYDDDRL